jgi:hypothetical protein
MHAGEPNGGGALFPFSWARCSVPPASGLFTQRKTYDPSVSIFVLYARREWQQWDKELRPISALMALTSRRGGLFPIIS